MSTGGLCRTRLERMHDVMARHVDSGEVPGLVTLISRHGEVHVDTIGTKAVGDGDPMRRDTIFRITSMTKPDGGRDDDPDRGVPAAPGRARRSVAAGAGGPPRAPPARRAARRHRAGAAADHGTRPAGLQPRLRRHYDAVGRLPDPEGGERAPALHRPPEAGHAARARRMDAAPRIASA